MRWMMGRARLLGMTLVIALLAGCQSAPAPAPAATPKSEAKPAEAPKPVASPAAAASPAASPSASPSPSPAAKPAVEAPKPSGPLTSIKVGAIGSPSDAGVYIALERGYFAAEGLDVELVPFDSAARMPPAIGTEQIQVGGGTLSAGLFNLVAREVPLKVVADKGLMPKGFGYLGLMVRKDLLDSGEVKDPKDLKGRKIAHFADGSGTHYLLDLALRKGGLTDKDVELTTMPYPDMVAAIGNKSVDAAIFLEPNGVRAEEQGLAIRWMPGDEINMNHQLGVLFYSPGFVKQEALARGFMVAYVRGVRDYNNAFLRNQDKDAIVAILAKHGTIKDPAMYAKMIPPGFSPDGRLNMESVTREVDWYVERGYIRERPNLDQIVDDQYVRYALETLGPAP